MTVKSAFAPVVDGNTRLLIVGSLPGEASLAAGQYYAHPRNLFWPLLGSVLDTDLADMPYPVRLSAICERGIGLWDTIARAHREGSLDGAIRGADHADLANLAASLPQLSAVAFNGRKAWSIGAPQMKNSGLELLALPSSSPAYAAMPRAEKEARWMVLRNYL